MTKSGVATVREVRSIEIEGPPVATSPLATSRIAPHSGKILVYRQLGRRSLDESAPELGPLPGSKGDEPCPT